MADPTNLNIFLSGATKRGRQKVLLGSGLHHGDGKSDIGTRD